MHDNRATFLAKTALVINCEHVSVTQTYFDRSGPFLHNSDNIDARRWWINGSDKLAAAALAALGIVYGDLGTSPLYTYQTIVASVGGKPSAEDALGLLSLHESSGDRHA